MKKGKFLELLAEAAKWFEETHQVKFEVQPYTHKIRLWFEKGCYCPVEVVAMHRQALKNMGDVQHPTHMELGPDAARSLGIDRIDMWILLYAADKTTYTSGAQYDATVRDKMLEAIGL
jgi:hypothetical protein